MDTWTSVHTLLSTPVCSRTAPRRQKGRCAGLEAEPPHPGCPVAFVSRNTSFILPVLWPAAVTCCVRLITTRPDLLCFVKALLVFASLQRHIGYRVYSRLVRFVSLPLLWTWLLTSSISWLNLSSWRREQVSLLSPYGKVLLSSYVV